MNKEYKQKILNLIIHDESDCVEQFLENYEKKNPKDRDILEIRINKFIAEENHEQAFRLAKKMVRMYPTSWMAYECMARVYEHMQKEIEALQAYRIAMFLYVDSKGDTDEWAYTFAEKIAMLEAIVLKKMEQYEPRKNGSQLNKIAAYLERAKTCFGMQDFATRNDDVKIIGTEYWVTDEERRYVGLYRTPNQELY